MSEAQDEYGNPVDSETGEVHEEGPEFDDSEPANELAAIVKALKVASYNPKVWDRLPNQDKSPYIPWGRVAGLLDEHAPDWSSATTRSDIRDGLAVVTVALCIVGVVRESTAAQALQGVIQRGQRKGEKYDIDAVEIAERKAFRRAAALFGVGRRVPNGIPNRQDNRRN